MRRSILLMGVMIIAVVFASSAVAYAKQSEKPASDRTTTLGASNPITIENHSWNGWHWARTSNPFTLKVGDNVSSSWDSLLDKTISDWSQSTVLDLNKADGGTNPRACRPTSGRVEICNAKYGDKGWLGLASVWVSSGHITQGTVKVNDTYYNDTSGYPYNNSMDKLHTICQELGHTFGLGHQDESGANLDTCMDYSYNTSETDTHSTTPNQGDYDELLCLYDPATNGVQLLYPRDSTPETAVHKCTGTGHLDNTTTVGQRAKANKIPDVANRPDFNDPRQWGQKIWSSPNRREEIWVRDFGGGNLVFNFVIRADEETSSPGA